MPMGRSSRLYVDPLTLREFHATLQTRLDAAQAALSRLDPPRGRTAALLMPDPALGSFYDAVRTTLHHEQLRKDYLVRLRRLVTALHAAVQATEKMIERFDFAEQINTAQMRQILHRLGEELEHGSAHG